MSGLINGSRMGFDTILDFGLDLTLLQKLPRCGPLNTYNSNQTRLNRKVIVEINHTRRYENKLNNNMISLFLLNPYNRFLHYQNSKLTSSFAKYNCLRL